MSHPAPHSLLLDPGTLATIERAASEHLGLGYGQAVWQAPDRLAVAAERTAC